MDEKLLGFIATKTIAKAEGVDDQRSTQLGIIGWAMGLKPISILIAKSIAAKEVEAASPAPVTTGEGKLK
jgi:hypothetical protein